jgi:hypothetical protein
MKDGWKKSKKTGVVYRGISMKDYSHLYEYMYDLFYVLKKERSRYFPNYYELEALGKREHERFKKEVNSWEQKWTLNDKLIETGPLQADEVYGMYEVKPNTVPDHLKDEVTEEYLKPTVRRYIKPKTKELFGDII